MKKIAFVNITPNCIGPMINALKKFGMIKPSQYMDSTIQDEIARDGYITDRCMGKMLTMISNACKDQVDGIVVTCTMFSKYVKIFNELFSIPIIAADVAMMEKASKKGGKYALLCTFHGTKEASTTHLKKYCEMSGKEYFIDTYVLEDAYEQAQKGNLKKHNEIIKNKIELIDKEYDNIVLAQMSMADAADLAKISHAQIYTSPESALETIQELTGKKILGCIADDFTGASDAASFLAKKGVKTILYNGIPKEDVQIEDVQAIVIALKTRTKEKNKAVKESLDAAKWLIDHGARQLYVKYCSTFDSTKEGNIGPIMDALLEEYKESYSILCPSLPINGRTVEQGRLYVNGTPLDESSMKDHPLTPMRDCKIKNLMEAQSKYLCLNLYDIIPKEKEKIEQWKQKEEHFYVIPDYKDAKDAKKIVEMFGELPILSGGSGLLEYLANKYDQQSNDKEQGNEKASGRALLLAGSCSMATRKQIEYMRRKQLLMMKVDPLKLLSGKQNVNELWKFIENTSQNVLIYSSDTPENVKQAQTIGKEKAAEILETTMAELAKRAIKNGITRIVIAGGETSGAVTKALEYDSYRIGKSVEPGVPIMIPEKNTNLRLILKSGNFGKEDFMEKAIEMTGRQDEK